MTERERDKRSERLTYTVQQVAEALGVSTDLVYDLCRRGELKSVKAGRRRLVRADSLGDWIIRHTQGPDREDAS